MNKYSREEVISYLKEHRKFLEENFGLKKIGLFGSYARNENISSSDIDILFEIDEKRNFPYFNI